MSAPCKFKTALRRPPRLLLLPVLAAGVAILVSAQRLPWHPKQSEALAGVTRVLLDTPTVHVEKWTTTSGYDAEGTADYVRRSICGTMDQILEERQVEVEDYMMCLGESEAAAARREALTAAGARFRELSNEWVGTHRTEEKLAAFHLGEELAEIKKLEVDALIVVCANGVLVSKGERALSAMGAISGGAGGANLILHIGVIRPRSGELAFFTENVISGDFLKHPERLENSVAKALGAVFGRNGAAQKESKP